MRILFRVVQIFPHVGTILKDSLKLTIISGYTAEIDPRESFKIIPTCHFTTMPFAWISHPIKFTPPSSSDLQYVLLTCFLVFAISILEYWFPLRQHSSGTFPKSEFTQSSAPLIPQHSLFAWIKKFSTRKWIKNRFVWICQWIENKSYLYLIPNSRNDWWPNISY